ncbi:hypothetical protein [Streptomyces sp. NPDC003077]|uniref:hypothetical protein n=1 Tax=Streptomyces sp. NPDC003077 TaxID=3154443 RepID=UPI0033ACEF7E
MTVGKSATPTTAKTGRPPEIPLAGSAAGPVGDAQVGRAAPPGLHRVTVRCAHTGTRATGTVKVTPATPAVPVRADEGPPDGSGELDRPAAVGLVLMGGAGLALAGGLLRLLRRHRTQPRDR